MEQFFGPGCPWYDWFETFGEQNVKWCEQTLCAWINEPANAWSNLGYFIAAALIAREGMKRYASAVFVMGAGSFFYHATNNYFTQILDFIGMYVWVCLLLNWNLIRLKWVPESKRVYSYFGMIVFFTAAIPMLRSINIHYQIIIAVLGVAIIATEWMLRSRESGVQKDFRPLAITVLFVLLGEMFSLADVKRWFCDPQNHFLQGHAAWHVSSAIGIYFGSRFYRQFPQLR